ncbi:MAG: ABC transporter ATP-binding protein [Candidatus Binatus sp.]|uniref:ABC transporter ATP-binding protein n=1 Tax=Candidatus Binatus sp. TaxID=2811406 RepID=UPI00272213A9|nr:ABC transporter ATP-binding protein [Candidatus Binatus sp.]MDO8434064.1 ABC transporter ATP-binding protein [Candidatus Binatus sp.]
MGTFELYGHVIRAMRPHLGRLAIAIVAVLLASATEVLKPWPLKVVIDNVLRGAPLLNRWIPPLTRAELLLAACLSLVILYALLGLLNVGANYLTISIGQRMVNDLRARLFDHLQSLSLSFHRRREIGDLMVRITYDTYSIQTIAMNGFFPLLSASILLVGMFTVMIRMDAMLTLVALAIIPMMLLLIVSISGRIDAISGGARIKESRLFTVAQSALAAIHVVQAFTREGESYREFVESSSESLDATLRLYTLQTLYGGAVSVLIACGTATVIFIGAQHVLSGRLTIGDLIVFTTYLASLYAPVNQISQTYGQVEGAKAGLRRCLELLAIDPEIKDRPGAQSIGRARGQIEFDNVKFGYDPGWPVLKGINFKAQQGETIAIVGPSGAGKTTMASLLARFYEQQQGVIRIDGHDIRDLKLDSLRGNIAMVLQPPLVLGDSMRTNVAFGLRNASEAQIARAIEMARLDPVVAKLPRGIDEIVGQGGHSLSEGEAQRVTIARALLKDAPILIMDEPTSALDTETESMVLDAVREAMRGRTTLVIAHRLSTIQNADRILVLRDGLIAEQGTFNELLARKGFFSYLYNIQAWNREAAN